MQLGIFAKTFVRSNLEETFDAVKSHGLDCLQFNLTCAGLPTLPETIAPALVQRIRTELEERSLFMAAVSGTCNLIHPDSGQRAQQLKRLQTLISAAREFGTSVVTLCTGTRDAGDMWRAHPENHSPETRQDLREALEMLLPTAQKYQVTLGVEPEPANVIASAAQARVLLDDMKSPCLKIVLDAANLLAPHDLSEQRWVLSEAFDLLGSDIVLVHAKDLQPNAGEGVKPTDHPIISNSSRDAGPTTVAAGKGALDYAHYLSLLQKVGFDGSLILHSLSEAEVPESVAFLRAQISQIAARSMEKPNAVLQSRQP